MSAGNSVVDRPPEQPDGSSPAPGSRWLGRALVAGDVVCLVISLLLVETIARPGLGSGGIVPVAERIGLLTVAGLYLIRHKQLYRAARSSVITVELAALCHVGVSLVAVGVLLDEFTGGEIWWARCVAGGSVAAVFLILWRSAYRTRLRAFRLDGRFVRPVMIVGVGPESKRLHRLLHDHPDAGFRSVGVVGDREQAKQLGLGGAWAGPIDTAIAAVEEGDSTGVILVSSALRASESSRIARRIQEVGGHVHVSSGIGGIDHRRFITQPIAHEPLLYLEPPRMPESGRIVKRVIDIVLATLGLIVTAPVMLLAAMAVKIEDGGPIIFRQRRVGHNGELFTILKLRTMVIDAEKVRERLQRENRREGPLFKLDHDPRITRVGRVLRATDLDEVPQLFNVLRGQMSMVGPRPALPKEVAQFDSDLRRRTHVPPGLTGLWQVEARDNPSFEAYQRLDLFYVENWSVALDLVILLLTVESKVVQALSKRHSGEMLSVDDELDSAAIDDDEPVGAVETDAATAPVSGEGRGDGGDEQEHEAEREVEGSPRSILPID